VVHVVIRAGRIAIGAGKGGPSRPAVEPGILTEGEPSVCKHRLFVEVAVVQKVWGELCHRAPGAGELVMISVCSRIPGSWSATTEPVQKPTPTDHNIMERLHEFHPPRLVR